MTAVDQRPGAAALDTATTDANGFEAAAARVDAAVAAVAALDPAARAAAEELQAALEAFHRGPLVHVVRTLRDDPRGKELLFELVDDPGVHAVLALHGIVKASPLVRAQRALDTIRPYLQSHGGDVDLVDVRDGTAQVRLRGSCTGCSMSAVTLREGVEEALVRMVPEITAVQVLDDAPTEAFVPLGSIGRRSPVTETGWVAGPAAADLAPGTLHRFDHGAESYVITNVDQRLAAFRNECVHQGMSLDAGALDAGVLTCPWHGFRFDATSGECLTAPGAQLRQVPLRVDGGQVHLRVG